MAQQTEIAVTVPDILAIIGRMAREVSAETENPKNPPEALIRHITRMFSFAEKLNEIYQEAVAANGAGNSAEDGASSEAPN